MFSVSNLTPCYHALLPSQFFYIKVNHQEFKPHAHRHHIVIIVIIVIIAMLTFCYFIMSHARVKFYLSRIHAYTTKLLNTAL